MKDFLKKNFVLFCILILSIVTFIILMALALLEWNKVKTYQSNLVELRTKVQKLNEEKPYPLKENLDNINKDTEILAQKVEEVNKLFGKPYQKALNEFVKALEENQEDNDVKKTKKDFVSEWRKYFKNNFKKNEQPEKLLKDFLSKQYTDEKINEALKAFVEIVKTRSVEKINESNQFAILLDALAVPRILSPDACKVYILKMEEELNNFAKSKEFGNPILFDEKSNVFKVYPDTTKLPPVDFIPHIIKHYKLIEDLLYRMKASGIDNMTKLEKLNGLEGTRDGNYLVFMYQTDIIASSDNVRKFLDSLLAAHQDNIIYVVKSLSFSKASDEMKGRTETKNESHSSVNVKRRASQQETPPTTTTEKLILGANDKIKAEIKFLYIIYVGDELKTR